MTSYKRFGATNEPDTCLWCGCALRSHPRGGRGHLGDGLFCSLSCGYLFGRQSALLGERLEAKAQKAATE